MFQTADGYVNIAASGDNLWRRFCEVAGTKDLADSPDFATVVARARNRPALKRDRQAGQPPKARSTKSGRPADPSERLPQPDELRPTPDQGEHTDAVLRELGYDAEAIAGLRHRGIV